MAEQQAHARLLIMIDSSGDRFWKKVEVCGGGLCWEWLASKDGTGYGAFKFNGRKIGAHVFSWMFYHRACVPRGLIVMHNCDNKSCVNPEHLQSGTFSQNNRDAYARGLKIPAKQDLAECGTRTASAYRRGCRCGPCRLSQNARVQRWRRMEGK